MTRKLKHDHYLDELVSRIKPSYDKLYTNVRLVSKKKKRSLAEIDVIAIKEDIYDVYEVKCSHRIVKARKQLSRIKRLLPQTRNLFFFCGDSGQIFPV